MIFSRFFFRLKRKRRSLVYYFKPGPLKNFVWVADGPIHLQPCFMIGKRQKKEIKRVFTILYYLINNNPI